MSPSAEPESPSAAADRIEREVIERISPSAETLRRIAEVRERLIARAEEAAKRRHSPLVRCLVAGSAARGTFLADRIDIDFFLLFPPSLGRKELELEGLGLAGELFESAETRYAEHPYLRGTFEGFAVDAVPGYAITDPSQPLSAVDRTPFHQEFLKARTTPKAVGEVRLTKQFLRSLGVYGSEARTGGFSGFLVELLVLRFGSLRALLADARHWRLPVHLPTDPTARPRVPADVALVLDDPVDPHRNVATALTRRNLSLFVLAAGAYVDHPSLRWFEVRPTRPPTLAEARAAIARRGTHVAVLLLGRPSLVDDILYPQLRKAERALADAAERLGFDVIGTASAAGERSVAILVESGHASLPAVRVHDGPPVGIDRDESFLEKWTETDAPVLQGPYVTADGHLAVDTLRLDGRIERLLSNELGTLPVGKDLKPGVGPTTALRALEETAESPELDRALGELLDKRLPWLPPIPRPGA
jgi:tRNA nucleotidyltransferase (CCA-adding enzyme)